MQNATAAGPSRGLLDIIFGSGKETEEAEADGQGFANLMNFIKAMNGEKSEEKGAGSDRTLVGIPLGKGMAAGQADGTPSGKAATSQLLPGQQPVPEGEGDAKQKEKLAELSALLGLPAAQAPRAQPLPAPAKLGAGQEKLTAVSSEQVNASLKQQNLPPLNGEELKLLQAVNTKLEQAQKLPEGQALPTAAAPAAGMAASSGKTSGKLAETEISSVQVSGAPEKIVSTESYLQMHESVGKGPVKDAARTGAQATNAEAPASASSAAGATLTSAAVAGAGTKGLELGARKDREHDLGDDRKPQRLDLAGSSTFGAALAQGTKELSSHDVYLPGLDKPDQFRDVLLNDVGAGVALHAHRGGGEMKLVLHPDDMGEVKLKVSTKNGKVEVQLQAENNDVANVLRSGSKDLEASLKDQNLTLAKFDVSVADSSSVSNLDKGSSLNDQFLSQNQQQQSSGFGQEAASDQGRQPRWDTNHGNGRQGSFVANEYGMDRKAPAAAHSAIRQPARVSSGRLDVVA